MSLKREDLARQMQLKIDGQRKGAAVPGRFAQGAGEVVTRKEQRRRDAAAGLVPFACKLPAELAQQLRERAEAEGGDLNALVTKLLTQALG